MTVGELIKKLQECSEEARICVLVYDEIEGCGLTGKICAIKERETSWGEKLVILHDDHDYS